MSDAESDSENRDDGPVLGTYTGDRNPEKQRHGSGKNLFPNGDIYTGRYENGKRQGHGFYKWKNGHRYVGNYDDNSRDGSGTMIYPDGSRYKGEFLKGKRNGVGIYTYVNGDTYEGQFENDLKHGNGVYTYSGSGSKKSGIWVQGKLEGMGEIIHSDVTLSGKFLNNNNMAAPIKLKFKTSNYEQIINNPEVVNMEIVSSVS